MRFFVFITVLLVNESFMKSDALFPKMDKLKSFLFGDVSKLQFQCIFRKCTSLQNINKKKIKLFT